MRIGQDFLDIHCVHYTAYIEKIVPVHVQLSIHTRDNNTNIHTYVFLKESAIFTGWPKQDHFKLEGRKKLESEEKWVKREGEKKVPFF